MSELKKLLEGVKMGWQSLATVANIYDGTHQTPKYVEMGVPFVSVQNIKNLYATNKYISLQDFEKYKYKPQRGDIFMTRIGSIGSCAIVENDNPLAYYVTLTLIRVNHDVINSKYLKHIIESTIGQRELLKRTLVNATPIKINLGEIGKIQIPIPCPENPEKSLKIQEKIVRILDRLSEETNQLNAALQKELVLHQKRYDFYREELFKFEGKEVEWKSLGDILKRTKGTKITAEQMKKIHKANGKVKIFAGGKTVAFFNYEDIPIKDINHEPSIIVKSRGFIEFEYYDKPFSHKSEMWSYYSNNNYLNVKFIYYFLKIHESHFQILGKRMQMPQISIPDTDKFKIPVPCPNDQKKSLQEQLRIVNLLDDLDTETKAITKAIQKEITLRNKQYVYYRDRLLSFPK